MDKFMSVSDYRKRRFRGSDKPCERTIKRWINEGVLPGEKIGGKYFVNISQDSLDYDPKSDLRFLRILEKLGISVDEL